MLTGHTMLARGTPQVWQTLAAVLHMSNLGFDKVDNEQGEIAAISDRAVREATKNGPDFRVRLCASSVVSRESNETAIIV